MITPVDMRALVLVLSLLATPIAFAQAPKQLSLPVGHSMTLAMPNTVSKVSVEDPSLVEVKTVGRNVTLVARVKGTTEAVVKTVDGEHHFKIYVAADKYALPY